LEPAVRPNQRPPRTSYRRETQEPEHRPNDQLPGNNVDPGCCDGECATDTQVSSGRGSYVSPGFSGEGWHRTGVGGAQRLISAERALRIFGATLAERERRGIEWGIPSWAQLLDEHLGRARAAVGSEAAAAAEAEGRALPFERAVEETVRPAHGAVDARGA
jgi:hypothetical protein